MSFRWAGPSVVAGGLCNTQAGGVALLKLLGRVERTVGTHPDVEHLREISPGRVLAPTEHGHFVLQRPERCSANLGAAATPRFGGRVWAPVCSTGREVQPWANAVGVFAGAVFAAAGAAADVSAGHPRLVLRHKQ